LSGATSTRMDASLPSGEGDEGDGVFFVTL